MAPPGSAAEAFWRRRFRAVWMTVPHWARDSPGRLIHHSDEPGRTELFAWDLATGERWQATDRPAGTRTGALTPDGGRVWWFDDRDGSEHGVWMSQPFAPRAAAEPAAPGVEPAYSAGLALGRILAVVGTSSDEGSRISVVRAGAGPRVIYQNREDAEVASLSRDDRLVAIHHSEHGDSRHPAVRVLDVDGRAVAGLWDGPGLGLWARDWSPAPGDHRLLLIHEREGIDRPAVWAPLTGQLRPIDLDLPGEVRASWYPDAAALLLAHDYAGRTELYRCDLPDAVLRKLGTPSGTLAGAAARPDGRLWYQHSSGGRPPALLDDGAVLIRPPGEAPAHGVPYSDLSVGDIHGFLAEPGGSRPHPTVMLVHGGPAARYGDAFSPRVQAWVDHGFAVAMVNYRGSTGYGKRWRDALEGNPGFTELDDLAAVRTELIMRGVADQRRMVLAGGSWGGYLTLLGLGVQPELWSLGLATVPVADYAAAYEDEMEPLKAFDRALFGGTPAERPGFYAERSPITYADAVRVPVLIAGGRNDPRCPFRQIENYTVRLTQLGKPFQFYEFDAGHGSEVVDEQIRQMEIALDFCHRYLGTPAPV